jgi:methylenetetrahydrofolate reductase (NADPH)
MIEGIGSRFITLIEVMPPRGPRPEPVLAALEACRGISIDGFSVPTNPVARPYLDALTLCSLVRRQMNIPSILHCTTRDHNSIGLQSLLWGAKVSGIETVVAASGDAVGAGDSGSVTAVRDIDVFGLVRLCRDEGYQTGVVFDPRWDDGGIDTETDRLRKKADAGAQFVVTQPVYDRKTAEIILKKVRSCGIPVIMGILPLYTPRHAEFLHTNVSGIVIPEEIRDRMHAGADPVEEGMLLARQMYKLAGEMFAGACLMPPFHKYELVPPIMGNRLDDA